MATTASAEALEQWLRNLGGYLHDSVWIADDEEKGLHWKTTERLMPHEVLATVPHSLALSQLNALVDDAFPVFKQQKAGFKVESIGFFYLMAQYIHREKSFWKPYIDTLPGPDTNFSTPLWFEDPEDIKFLEDTDVWRSNLARKEIYERYYQDGVAALKRGGLDVEPYTWLLFKWATTIFTSRSFSSRALQPQESNYWTAYKCRQEDGRRQTVLMDMSHASAEDLDFPVLFPVLDVPNHSHDAKVDWTFDQGRFSITSSDGALAGDELMNNYGPKGNDELLLGYGFCIDGNPHDSVLLTLKTPSEELQQSLRSFQPGYFKRDGSWNAEKATFRLTQVPSSEGDPMAVFNHVPEPFLELCYYTLRSEAGLPFAFAEEPRSLLMSPDSSAHRYLVGIARMFVMFFLSKPGLTRSEQLTGSPRNEKQRHALIYQQSQARIIDSIMVALKRVVRSQIWQPDPGETRMPIRPCLVRIQLLLRVLDHDGTADTFLAGIAANANTRDVEQLRLAGWEEDMWVLLLCSLFLEPNKHEPWLGRALPEFLAPEHLASLKGEISETSLMDAQDLMEVVRAAAAALPQSMWADDRWSAEFIASHGGKWLQFGSMLAVCPSLEGEGEGPALCVYMHG